MILNGFFKLIRSYKKGVSSRMVRKLVKKMGTKNPDIQYFYDSTTMSENEKIHKMFDKIMIALRILIKNLATIIENAEDIWILYEIFMQHKHIVHQQVDLLIREKENTENTRVFWIDTIVYCL
jgi:hypothetical protein